MTSQETALSGAELGVRVKMPRRGPVKWDLPSGGCLDLWYDRETRLWVLQQKDVAGNQVGPAYGGGAEYQHRREDLVDQMREILAGERDAGERHDKGGRPSKGLTESAVLLRLPKSLLEEVTEAASISGEKRSEWIREALRRRVVAQLTEAP